MRGKKILILSNAPRIDRYVYELVWADEHKEIFTTLFAAYRTLKAGIPDKDAPELVGYPQVARNVRTKTHHTFVTKHRNVYQIRSKEVFR